MNDRAGCPVYGLEAICHGRFLMLSFFGGSNKFRKILPLLQLGATILLSWMYYVDWRIVTPLVLRTPAGERTFMVHGSPDSYSRQLDWVQAINFPAGWIVLPAELAASKGEGGRFGYPIWRHSRFVGFAVMGLFVWFLAGRHIDSTVAMFESARRSCQKRRTGFSRSLSRQLTAQLLGKLFHSLELLDNIFREQSTIRTVYVSMDGRRKFGEFLSIAL